MIDQSTSAASTAGSLSNSECQHILSSTDTGGLRLDEAGTILEVNTFLSNLLKYSPQELTGMPLWELGGALHRDIGHHLIERLQRSGHLRSTDLPLVSKDGICMHFEFRLVGHLHGDSDVIECVFQDLEVAETQPSDSIPFADTREQRLLYRRQFEETVQQEIDRTRNDGPPLSLLSIGIDRISSTRSDAPLSNALLLRGFATACTSFLRATDSVCRVDDTVFVALLPGVGARGALCAAERLRTAITSLNAFTQKGELRRITVSIGVVATRTGRTTYKALRSRADSKRDDAANSGGNRVNA